MSTISDSFQRPAYDPRRTLNRYRWAKWVAFGNLLGRAALVGWAVAEGSWGVAIVAGLLLLPDAWIGWRELPDANALDAGGDFLEAEREALENRLLRHRARAVTYCWMAAGLAWLTTLAKDGHRPLLWCLVAFLIVQAIVRVFVVSPAIVRELRDFGIPRPSWTPAVVGSLFVLLVPLLAVGALGRLVYRDFRRMIGRPLPVEKDDDEGGA